MTLVAPHGGILVDRVVTPDRVAALVAEAAALPRLVLDDVELADLELIATGAASPLTGFLGPADHARVLAEARLASGALWPVPLVLAVEDGARAAIAAAGAVALHDAGGRLWAVLRDAELFTRDPVAEARAVFGTDDVNHPAVARLLRQPRTLVGGPIDALPLPEVLPFAGRRLTPRQLRAELTARGWRRVAGLRTGAPVHRALEHLTRIALESCDGLVLHAAAADGRRDDVPAEVRFRTYDALVAGYYPAGRALIAAHPGAPRFAGGREALLDVLIAKNHGVDRLIVGPDHGRLGGPAAPRPGAGPDLLDAVDAAELGVAPLRLEAAFHCRTCDAIATARTCGHDPAGRRALSGTRVRDLVRAGRHLPRELVRPEVAAILRAHYLADVHEAVAAAPAPARPAVATGGGFIVWLTGLSGAGKSTLATALAAHLAGERQLEILDGDEVRTHLSKGLGFSREDRDVNVERIGFVARTLARHGVGVVTAAISPYADTRRRVRQAAEERGLAFVEVHVKAELGALVQRDVKGLYKRALAGEVPHFSGISDPYEPPEHPDVVVRTDQQPVEASLALILAALEARGLIAARAPAVAPPAVAATGATGASSARAAGAAAAGRAS
ncbi:MAG: adenylyl-sulfate kinase [Kofleriaceae bacterium]|nr:adenylyl-sulfate kinase [Kofleriaceae bacterium]